MAAPITPESLLDECRTLSDAKAIARDMRATCKAVESRYGPDHIIAREFSARYFGFVDAMADRFHIPGS